MKCPVCGVPLSAARLGFDDEIEIDACRKCDGMWLDAGELDELDDSVRTDAEELPVTEVDGDEEQLPCPRCVREGYRGTEHAALRRVKLASDGPALLSCPSCGGFFVTPDELELVRDHVLRVDSEQTRGLKVWRKVVSRDKHGHTKVSWVQKNADEPPKAGES